MVRDFSNIYILSVMMNSSVYVKIFDPIYTHFIHFTHLTLFTCTSVKCSSYGVGDSRYVGAADKN